MRFSVSLRVVSAVATMTAGFIAAALSPSSAKADDTFNYVFPRATFSNTCSDGGNRSDPVNIVFTGRNASAVAIHNMFFTYFGWLEFGKIAGDPQHIFDRNTGDCQNQDFANANGVRQKSHIRQFELLQRQNERLVTIGDAHRDYKALRKCGGDTVPPDIAYYETPTSKPHKVSGYNYGLLLVHDRLAGKLAAPRHFKAPTPPIFQCNRHHAYGVGKDDPKHYYVQVDYAPFTYVFDFDGY